MRTQFIVGYLTGMHDRSDHTRRGATNTLGVRKPNRKKFPRRGDQGLWITQIVWFERTVGARRRKFILIITLHRFFSENFLSTLKRGRNDKTHLRAEKKLGIAAENQNLSCLASFLISLANLLRTRLARVSSFCAISS